MKKIYKIAAGFILATSISFAASTAFDSMDKAVEVKLSPAIQAQNQAKAEKPATTIQSASSSPNSIQAQKYNNALVNLDDAQVELRQDLSTVTARYNEALAEKQRAIQNCKNLKKEIKAINKKMKNVDKSKKMINANLETDK